jgi:hypothetical protein
MTSYAVERPAQHAGRTRLAHLRAGEATTGQPVTIRTLDEHGREIEFPAVYVRMDANHLHLRCAREGEETVQRYRPTQVFPRRVTYRRWVVTLRHKAMTDDGDGFELYPVLVHARTELEARYEALKQVRARHGERSNWSFTLHSVRREG